MNILLFSHDKDELLVVLKSVLGREDVKFETDFENFKVLMDHNECKLNISPDEIYTINVYTFLISVHPGMFIEDQYSAIFNTIESFNGNSIGIYCTHYSTNFGYAERSCFNVLKFMTHKLKVNKCLVVATNMEMFDCTDEEEKLDEYDDHTDLNLNHSPDINAQEKREEFKELVKSMHIDCEALFHHKYRKEEFLGPLKIFLSAIYYTNVILFEQNLLDYPSVLDGEKLKKKT